MGRLQPHPLRVYNTNMSFTEIKNAIVAKAQLDELVGQTVNLKKAGGRYMGLCPFHDEKTPSFTVYNNRYFCFGCKASGDVIEFVRKTSGSSFIDTLHFLGAKYGVDTDALRKKRQQHGTPRKLLHAALLKARDFFHHNLNTAAGQRAVTYLQQRGVSSAEIKHNKIGYALTSAFALKEHLRREGVPIKTAVATSLLNVDPRKGDFFRNRIMFPVHDSRGQVVGFGGRTLDPNNHIKYLNSRENELFHKAKVLFGLWHAAQAIAAEKTVIVVEGYFDWLALQRAKLNHCVACMGTALTPAQLRLLQRHIDKVILLFDGDHAGTEAARHALQLAAVVPQLSIRVAQLAAGHDPDSWLQQHGPEALQQLLAKAEDVVEFSIIGKLRDQQVQNYASVLRTEILPLLRQINDPLQRGELIAKISQYSGIARQSIEQELRGIQGKQKTTKSDHTETLPLPSRLHEWIGHLYYAEPQQLDLNTLQLFVQQELEFEPEAMLLLETLLRNLQQGTCNYNCTIDTETCTPPLQQALAKVRKDHALYNTDHRHALDKLMLMHKRKKIKEKISFLQKDLHRADEPHQRELLATIVALRQQNAAITTTDKHD